MSKTEVEHIKNDNIEQPWIFKTPQKYIVSTHDIQLFKESLTYKHLVDFVTMLSMSVRGYSTESVSLEKASLCSVSVVKLLDVIEEWIQVIPPLQGSMRFGNKAFQTWIDKLQENAPELTRELLSIALQSSRNGSTNPVDSLNNNTTNNNPSQDIPFTSHGSEKVLLTDSNFSDAVNEISFYLTVSFGDRTRVDFGSGHELSFIAFLYCLFRVGCFNTKDFRDIVLIIFSRYLRCVRELQKTYCLEPAGSRGVWGLDDYHFLPFLFGAAQLVGQTEIKPSEVADPHIIRDYNQDYLYLDAIRWIFETKAGTPFAECSPLLNDITAVPTWSKIHTGMIKMYQAEVLSKIPVMQHFLFGSLLPHPPGMTSISLHTGKSPLPTPLIHSQTHYNAGCTTKQFTTCMPPSVADSDSKLG